MIMAAVFRAPNWSRSFRAGQGLRIPRAYHVEAIGRLLFQAGLSSSRRQSPAIAASSTSKTVFGPNRPDCGALFAIGK